MKKYLDVLANCPLFEDIDNKDIGAMLGCLGGRLMDVKKNSVIFEEGAPAREFGIVLAGRLQVARTDIFGKRSIMLSVGAGELFGEAFACAEVKQLPVSVDTAEDGAVLLVDCRRLMTTCSNACSFHSRLIFNLLKTVARKNIELHRHAEIVSGRTTREKLMSYLTMQASQAGTLEFVVPFDRQALADHLGVDRSGLSAEIGKLKREGILECSRSSFRLLRDI